VAGISSKPSALLILAFLLALAGCEEDQPKKYGPPQTFNTTSNSGSGGGAGSNTATNSGQGGHGTGKAGKMTITAKGLDAYDGSKLVALVADEQPTENDYGAICQTVAGPDFSISAVVSKKKSMDPCDLGEPVSLDPKSYFVFAGLFKPGAMEPDGCMEVLVEVNGDVSVELPAVEPCKQQD